MKVKDHVAFSSSCIYLHNALSHTHTHILSFFFVLIFSHCDHYSCIYVYFLLFFCQIHVFFFFFSMHTKGIAPSDNHLMWEKEREDTSTWVSAAMYGFHKTNWCVCVCLPSIDTWKGVLNIWESLAAWIGNEVGSGQLTLVLFWILTLLLITCRAQYIGDGSDRRASLLRIPSHGVIPYPLFSSAWHLSIMSNMIENQPNGPSFLPFVCHHLSPYTQPSHSTTYAVYSTLLYSPAALWCNICNPIITRLSLHVEGGGGGWSMYALLLCIAYVCVWKWVKILKPVKL